VLPSPFLLILMHIFFRGKSCLKVRAPCRTFKTLAKVNNRPTGKNSPIWLTRGEIRRFFTRIFITVIRDQCKHACSMYALAALSTLWYYLCLRSYGSWDRIPPWHRVVALNSIRFPVKVHMYKDFNDLKLQRRNGLHNVFRKTRNAVPRVPRS
jgi:hypothetical protein